MSNNKYISHTGADVLRNARRIGEDFKAAHDGQRLGGKNAINLNVKTLKTLHNNIKRVVGDADRIGILSKEDMVAEGKWIGGRVSFPTGRGGRIDMTSQTNWDIEAIKGTKDIRKHFDDALAYVITKARTAQAGRQHRIAYGVISKWRIPSAERDI